jgi:hypothetical protein
LESTAAARDVAPPLRIFRRDPWRRFGRAGEHSPEAFHPMTIRLAQRLGTDIDHPRHLQKVTRTR